MPRHRDHAAETGGALHFYLDDYRFETAWSSPERLLSRVTAVGAALTPDFSVWRDIPRATQIWNTYRSRWCGAYWQAHGVKVIPTVGWGAPDTYDFCFDGIPQGTVVSVSDVGMKNNELDKELFRLGMREMVDRINPLRILAYGRLRYCDSLDLPRVVEYPTYWDRRRKQISEWENEEEHSEGADLPPQSRSNYRTLSTAASTTTTQPSAITPPVQPVVVEGLLQDPAALVTRQLEA